MNFKNEDEMRKKLLEGVEKRKIHLIDLGKGVFDLLLDSKTPRIIELKMIEHDFRISVGDNYGFEFTKNQTKESRKIKNPDLIPFVIACDTKLKGEERFYFITNKKLKKAMHVSNRDEYDKIIFNRVERDHLFKKRNLVTWKEVLQKLEELSED